MGCDNGTELCIGSTAGMLMPFWWCSWFRNLPDYFIREQTYRYTSSNIHPIYANNVDVILPHSGIYLGGAVLVIQFTPIHSER